MIAKQGGLSLCRNNQGLISSCSFIDQRHEQHVCGGVSIYRARGKKPTILLGQIQRRIFKRTWCFVLIIKLSLFIYFYSSSFGQHFSFAMHSMRFHVICEHEIICFVFCSFYICHKISNIHRRFRGAMLDVSCQKWKRDLNNPNHQSSLNPLLAERC